MASLRSYIESSAGDGVVVEYDPDFHVYRVDGVAWPSVTQALSLLEDFGDIPAFILRRAAERGTRIHRICERMAVEDPSVHDALLGADEPFVVERSLQFSAFLREHKPEIIGTEVLIANPKLRYCGRADLVANIDGKVSLIDIKTGSVVGRTWGPQTAGYAAGHDYPKIQRRYCLHLQANDYKLIPYTDPTDMSIFVSALNVWRFKNER